MLRTQEEKQAEAWKQAIDAATELELQPKKHASDDPLMQIFDERSTGWTLCQGVSKHAMLSLKENNIGSFAENDIISSVQIVTNTLSCFRCVGRCIYGKGS